MTEVQVKNLKKPRTRPGLTLSGKVCEILGFLAGGLGVQLSHRGLLLLGLTLFVPVAVGLGLTWLQINGAVFRLRRPSRARSHESSPVDVEIVTRFPIMSLLVLDPSQKHGISLRVDDMEGGSTHVARGTEVLRRRGRIRPTSAVASTAQPLGLALAERRIDAEEDIIVWPALGRLRGRLAQLAGGERLGERNSRTRGQGGEVHHIRAFVPGDSSRSIHWPASARMGELMVREWEEEREGSLLVATGWHQHGRQRHFGEQTLSLLTTLVHHARRPLRILLPGHSALLEVESDSESSREEADDALALLPSSPGLPDWSLIEELGGMEMIFLHPGHEQPPSLPANVTLIDVDAAIHRGQFFPRGAKR